VPRAKKERRVIFQAVTLRRLSFPVGSFAALRIGHAGILSSAGQINDSFRQLREHLIEQEKWRSRRYTVIRRQSVALHGSGQPYHGAQHDRIFYQAIQNVSMVSLRHHLIAGDFSRWVGDILGDQQLARGLRKLERTTPIGRTPDRAEILAHIEAHKTESIYRRYAIVQEEMWVVHGKHRPAMTYLRR
jgi:hypothetical protein